MNVPIQAMRSSNIDVLLNKTLLYSVFLFFNFMVTYRVLLISVIPAAELISEAVYILVIGVYLVYRIIMRVLAGNLSFNSLEIYLIVLFFLPLWAANGARMEFGQPIFYGLATFRDFYLIYGGLIVYNMLRSNQIDIHLVERMFVLTAWFCILMFYFMTLFTDPKQYLEYGLAGSNSAKGGDVYYRFNMAFVFFGSIYYFAKAFFEKKFHYVIYALIFLCYVVFLRFDRTSIAVLVAGIGLFYVTALTPRRQLFWILGLIPVVFLGLITLTIFIPELIDQYYLMFADAFATVGGSFNAEGEESVRLLELEKALKYIDKNPFVGNGKVSQQWVEGGYNHFMGFFYASDVGIFGQIFMYGFIGAFVLYFQFFLALNYALKIKHIKRNSFLVTLKFFLLALGLDTISNGFLTIYAAQSVTALILIYHFYERDKLIDYKLRIDKMKSVFANKPQIDHGTRGS